MTSAAIVWIKDWEGEPVAGADCRHPATEVLNIGLRLERGRGPADRRNDGVVCMLCGRDSTGRLTLVDGLARASEEHGWNRHVSERLFELIRAHRTEILATDEPLPFWFDAYLATVVDA